jgi:hypothetical protein
MMPAFWPTLVNRSLLGDAPGEHLRRAANGAESDVVKARQIAI